MLTCFPHLMKGEGQFAARLRRKGSGTAFLPADTSLPRPDRQQIAVLKGFSAEAPADCRLLGDTLFTLPGLPDVRGLRVLRAGLHLGSVRGRLFLPDHAWALSAQRPGFPVIELSKEQAAAYQHGEALAVSDAPSGYVLPTLKGLTLGWGKVSDGQMKNHYPKGLRR